MLEGNLYERLTIGTAFSRSLAIFSQKKELFVPMGLAFFIPFAMFMYTSTSMIGEEVDTLVAALEEDQQVEAILDAERNYMLGIAHQIKRHGFVLLLELFFDTAVAVFIRAATALVVAQLYVGQHNPDLSSILQRVVRLFCNIVAASFLVGISLGLLLGICFLVLFGCVVSEKSFLVVPGMVLYISAFVLYIHVSVAMMIVIPAVMIESLGPVAAIKRCWELAQNNRGFIFCTAFILGIVQGFAQQLIGGIISFGDPKVSAWNAVVSQAVTIFFTPVMCILTTVVYLSLRVQKEGMNQEVLERNLVDAPVSAEYAIVVDNMDNNSLSKALYDPEEDNVL